MVGHDGSIEPESRPQGESWDHSTRQEFLDYYSEASLSQAAQNRFRAQRDIIVALLEAEGVHGSLSVADIGAGPGASAMLWAELGHRVQGLDVNEALIQVARERAEAAGYDIRFEVGSATDLPWAASSMDVCLAPELLEHVPDWESCLDEFTRILKPGGALFLSTTNWLCPAQQEFNLPLYSWYPAPLKRYCEELARTSRPSIANYATYPAVNWFTYWSLRSALALRGHDHFYDRFDMAAARPQSAAKTRLLRLISNIPPLRWAGYVCSRGTSIVAIKADGPSAPR